MRVAAGLVLVLTALVVASAASARDPKQPQQRHTAADMALARSVALKRSDLAAGWTPIKAQPSPPCSVEPDESKLVETARYDPAWSWGQGSIRLESAVDIFRSAAEARTDWRLTTLQLIRTCLLESARNSLAKQHVTVKPVSTEVLSPPKQGDRSFHLRLAFELRDTKTKKAALAVTELVGFGIGRVTVVLEAFTFGAPLPASEIDALTAKLGTRLADATGGI